MPVRRHLTRLIMLWWTASAMTNGNCSARQARSCDDRRGGSGSTRSRGGAAPRGKQRGRRRDDGSGAPYGHIASGQAPILAIVRYPSRSGTGLLAADDAGQHALVVVDEQSRRRRHVRTPLPEFVVAQRRGDARSPSSCSSEAGRRPAGNGDGGRRQRGADARPRSADGTSSPAGSRVSRPVPRCRFTLERGNSTLLSTR